MYIIGILSVILLVAIDQLTKFLAVRFLLPVESIPIIKDVFELCYVENRGAAFGLLQGFRWGFLIITIPVIGVICYLYAKIPKEKSFRLMRISLILIGAGAIGNAIDRLINGYVVDFFYFKLIDFAVFNVADSFLVVGTILLAFLLLFVNKEVKF